MDTDSVVYLATQGETHLPRGRFLGQFKDELKGDINTWIKVKQEADGWPSPEVAKDPALQIEYLEEFRRVEGVILYPAKVERNEGRRTLGKLMANRFWGKFGQRTNKTQVTTCKERASSTSFSTANARSIASCRPANR